MRHNFNIFRFVFIGFLASLSLFSCSCSNIKLHPEYKGVDPKVQGLVNEYKELAKIQGITFKHEVTIGFSREKQGDLVNSKKTMLSGDVIGLCTYGLGWREIDISWSYWKTATSISRTALVWHELTHAYCDRDHDFEGRIAYPSTYTGRAANILEMVVTGKELPGYYPDLCPRSLMYPEILEDDCMMNHLDDYEHEMFSNCDVW